MPGCWADTTSPAIFDHVVAAVQATLLDRRGLRRKDSARGCSRLANSFKDSSVLYPIEPNPPVTKAFLVLYLLEAMHVSSYWRCTFRNNHLLF